MLTKLSRYLTALAALSLGGMLVLPLWRIGLLAPQYPEGLGMLIRIDTVTGVRPQDLDNINELNHYIGMRPIVTSAMPELRYMPWIVGALVVLGLGAALWGRRKGVVAWLAGLATFGALGLADFWRWAHEYGHNLDYEHAIIKVPGMTYDPPVIGIKHLLNFTAISFPASGGILAGVAFALGIAALWFSRKGAVKLPRGAAAVAAGALIASCTTVATPMPIQYGAASCDYCRMTVDDRRFAAELVNAHGKALTFDSIECLAGYVNAAPAESAPKGVYVTDFAHPGTLISADSAKFVVGSGDLSTPMGGGLLAFAAAADAQAAAAKSGGAVMEWSQVLARVRESHAATLAQPAGAAHAE